MIDLEKGKTSSGKRSEIHSTSIDKSVPIIVDDGSRERRDSFGEREQGIQLTLSTRVFRSRGKS
jgi:hypothetical protein